MTTSDQEVKGRYVAADDNRADLDARAVFVRDTIVTLYNASKKFRVDPADNGSFAELVDPPKNTSSNLANDVNPRSVIAPPTTGGDTA